MDKAFGLAWVRRGSEVKVKSRTSKRSLRKVPSEDLYLLDAARNQLLDRQQDLGMLCMRQCGEGNKRVSQVTHGATQPKANQVIN